MSSPYVVSGLTSNTPIGVSSGGTGVASSTGSGSVVLSNSPTLVTPVLGAATASSLVLSTPLPIASGGTGSGSSTGTGSSVLQTSPTLVTPVLGVATGTLLTTSGNITSTSGVLSAYKLASGASRNLNIAVDSAGYSVIVGGAQTPQGAGQAVVFNVARPGGPTDLFYVVGAGSGSGSDSIVCNCAAYIESTLQFTALTASTSLALNASKQVVSVTNTGSGSNVLATAPTLVTPSIGAATGTSLTVTGQLVSSVVTGTAPLSVASTTNVANLNASFLGGATFAAPGTIGGTTPGAATFTNQTTTTTTTLSGLTASTALALDGSKQIVSVTNTGSGSNVLATSPTLVTPNIGQATGVSLTLSGVLSAGSIALAGVNSAVDLNLSTAASYAVIAGKDTPQASGQNTFFKVQRPGAGPVLLSVTGAGSGSGSDYITLNTNTFAAGYIAITAPETALIVQSDYSSGSFIAHKHFAPSLSGASMYNLFGKGDSNGDAFQLEFSYSGANSASNLVLLGLRNKTYSIVMRNDSSRTVEFSGPIIAAGLAKAAYTQTLGPATISGQGGYTAWNIGGDGTMYFQNQQGGGSTGGFKFQTYDASNALTGGVMQYDHVNRMLTIGASTAWTPLLTSKFFDTIAQVTITRSNGFCTRVGNLITISFSVYFAFASLGPDMFIIIKGIPALYKVPDSGIDTMGMAYGYINSATTNIPGYANPFLAIIPEDGDAGTNLYGMNGPAFGLTNYDGKCIYFQAKYPVPIGVSNCRLEGQITFVVNS